jgi:hypothetical protein
LTWKLETGNFGLETGDRRLEAGGWELTADSRQLTADIFYSYLSAFTGTSVAARSAG